MRLFWRIALVALIAPVALIAAYRFVPPPLSALMLIRIVEGSPPHKEWVPLSRIAPALQRAVIASEDEKLCTHHGFDWDAETQAFRDWRAGRVAKGASTITMQTAKNFFLARAQPLAQGDRGHLTVWIELLWDKHRILEVYLNIVEWSDGLYGAEAAAEHFFARPASALTAQEAALLAAVLPNPRRWSLVAPTLYVAERSATIRARMPAMAIPGTIGCR